MDLLHRVQNLIEEKHMLKQGDGVIVGCSGGPDSLCLLHLFLRLRNSMDLTIRVVHLEHGFRGQASESDAQFVESFCIQHKIEYSIYRENVKQQAKAAGISEETAGREARYRCFFKEREMLLRRLNGKAPEDAFRPDRPAEEDASLPDRLTEKDASLPDCPTELEPSEKLKESVQLSELGESAGVEGLEPKSVTARDVKIAVAHNRNDQAETVLMRIMRGTGLEGLKGMELSRQDGIIRPLLTTDRGEIEAYCDEMGLQPRWDHTNAEADYTRNRIRLELIPYMKEHFNENIEDALCRLGRIAAEDYAVIAAEAERVKSTCAEKRQALVGLSDGLRHQVVRSVLADLGLEADVSAVHLEQIDRLLRSKAASGEVCLPRGYRVSVSYDSVLWEVPSDNVRKKAACGGEPQREFDSALWEESRTVGQSLWESMEADRDQLSTREPAQNRLSTAQTAENQLSTAEASGEQLSTAQTAQGQISVTETDWKSIGSLENLKRLPQNQRCFDGDKIRAALEKMQAAPEKPQEAPEETRTVPKKPQGAPEKTSAGLGGGLTLRVRRPGDFIRPLGSRGRKKLQDWFVDRKIPRKRRDEIPLVCIGSEVVWIVGYQISENYKVETHSKHLIFVEFHQ